MWLEQYNRYQIFTLLIFVLVYNGCEAESNSNFNEQIRNYSALNHDGNLTNVKTLQKENIGISRHTSFTPLQNVRFKEVPDNALSGTSHGRGLLHHEQSAEYGIYQYENPHYSHGYEYQPDPGLNPHDFHHYEFHDPHHNVGHHVNSYGHHPKHYDHHALAAKSLLWPIAGIALLGAAAALVSNPVLLQLGVVSGRKKRQIENLDFVNDSIKKWSSNSMNKIGEELRNIPELIVKRRFIRDDLKAKPNIKPQEDKMEHKSNSRIIKMLSKRYTDNIDEENMIPVPLNFKNNLNVLRIK